MTSISKHSSRRLGKLDMTLRCIYRDLPSWASRDPFFKIVRCLRCLLVYSLLISPQKIQIYKPVKSGELKGGRRESFRITLAVVWLVARNLVEQIQLRLYLFNRNVKKCKKQLSKFESGSNPLRVHSQKNTGLLRLKDLFLNRLLSQNGDISCHPPSRLPDLTARDFFSVTVN